MTETLTCAALYDSNPTFASGVNKWVADRRCPIQLGDYLEELGLSAPADCARWCAEQPDRRGLVETGIDSGPFPSPCDTGDNFHWFPSWSITHVNDYRPHAHEVPFENLKRIPCHPTRTAAILWLLDNWIPGNS